MINFEIQSHRPLRELVYEELRNAIMNGDMKPGTRMMEIELADSMGVSRTPIREAIRKLEKEGLVTIEPRKGAYVSTITMQNIIDIIQVRGTLEGLAAEITATKISPEQVEELREISEAFNKALGEGDTKGMIASDTLFHQKIVEIADNQLLLKLIVDLQEVVLRFRYLYYKDFKRAEKMPPEHEAMWRAMAKGDKVEARAAANRHIQSLEEMVINDAAEIFSDTERIDI